MMFQKCIKSSSNAIFCRVSDCNDFFCSEGEGLLERGGLLEKGAFFETRRSRGGLTRKGGLLERGA